jgi:two-component system response regulator HydG
MSMHNILVIDDDIDMCHLLDRFLTRNGFSVQVSYSKDNAFALIEKNNYDVVLSDFRLGNTDGREILNKVREKDPTTQVIIITGYSDVKIAVDVIKLGAFDYITKPLLPDEILLLVKRAIAKKEHGEESPDRDQTENKKQQKREIAEGNFIRGVSPEAKEVEKQIALVAPTNYSVIIYGESGTGKESVAQAIHNNSPRRNMPFVSVDCGALTKELAGSELFGHEKGAFTGALTQKIGHFEMANGGTVFLDEISNLPYDVQIALLRVVQERKLRRVGGTKEIDIDIRIIVASNEKLMDMSSKGKFREDLYHRFNEFSIHLYPLRERGKDIELFASHFLKLAVGELGKDIRGFSPEVVEVFKNYRWPGNLREMYNVIKRVALLTDSGEVQLNSLPHEISFHDKFSFNLDAAGDERPGIEQRPVKNDLKSIALSAEYKTIVEVLKQVNYNKSKAAKALDIDRKTLYNKLKQYQLL